MFVFVPQVLSQELADLKRRRAEARAENRALAKQEKTLKKCRARVLQVLVTCALD